MMVCLFFLRVFYIHDFIFYSGSVYVVRLEEGLDEMGCTSD